MEASAQMKWGIICSIHNEHQIPEFIECSTWLVRKLEESAVRLQYGHRFADNATFALQAVPGSKECVKTTYEKIAQQYPAVCYVIHILPSKDSPEYHVLKEMSTGGALIAQGVLAENALNHFSCYQLDEVVANMNQWIGRRLAQITARRTEEDALLAKQIKELVQISPQSRFPSQAKIPRTFLSNKQSTSLRKDNYQLTINSAFRGGGFGGRGGSRFNVTGGNATPLLECPLVAPSFATSRSSAAISSNTLGKSTLTAPNDFDVPTAIVLHSQSDPSTNPFTYRCETQGAESGGHPAAQKSASAPAQQLDGIEREKEIIVGGYPINFNKFQIASLFVDFRPLNVQYISAGEALVQFANKFHATQIIANYNGRQYEDEGFQLEVRPSAREDASKHIAAMKAKMAGLMLKITTKNAASKELTLEEGASQIDGSMETKTVVAKDVTYKQRRILSLTNPNEQK